MDRDFVKILSYGSKGHPNFGQTAYFDRSATITFADTPPQQGDAAPLLVYRPYFVVANISQSSPYPSSNNSISVTFATSVPLKSQSVITISGLHGSVTNSSFLDIPERSTNLASSGQWWSQNGSIEVSVVTATIAGEIYTFAFTIKNQECRRNAASVSIKATPVCFRWTEMRTDNSNSSALYQLQLLGIYRAQPEYIRPMRILSPSFVVYEVYQTSAFAGKNNTLNLRLATNVDMLKGTKITISNVLVGMSQSTIPNACIDEDDDHDCTSSIFQRTWTWDNASKSLNIELTSIMHAGTNYSLSFMLTNPSCCQPAVTVTINANFGSCFEPVGATPRFNSSLLNRVARGNDTETAPLLVRCPQWVVKAIKHSTDLPCFDNVLTVDLQANVPITAGSRIEIIGLINSRTKDGQLPLSSSVPGMSVGNFTQGPGVLIVLVGDEIEAWTRFTVSFTLINPASVANEEIRALLQRASIRIDMYSSCLQDNQRIAPAILNQTSDNVILTIRQAVFSKKEIGQKTPWPGALNLMTITLNSNVPLYGAQVRCDTNITISGFDGACIRGNRSQVLGINDTYFNHPQLRVLPLIGDNASIFAETTLNAGSSSAIRNRATWDGESRSVRMRLVGLLGGADSENRQQTQIVFSFELLNPVEAQASPRIEIEARGIPIARSEMIKDLKEPLNSLYDHGWNVGVRGVGSQNGAIFMASARDAEPLLVHPPAFIVKRVGQTSPVSNSLLLCCT
jgi:hypothetical protein